MQIETRKKTFDVVFCDTFFKRLVGFMFRRKRIDDGLCFPHCRAIHTFFMFQEIDLVLCDKNHVVLYLLPNFKRNRVLGPIRDVFYIYELPLGSTVYFEVGEKIKIKE